MMRNTTEFVFEEADAAALKREVKKLDVLFERFRAVSVWLLLLRLRAQALQRWRRRAMRGRRLLGWRWMRGREKRAGA